MISQQEWESLYFEGHWSELSKRIGQCIDKMPNDRSFPFRVSREHCAAIGHIALLGNVWKMKKLGLCNNKPLILLRDVKSPCNFLLNLLKEYFPLQITKKESLEILGPYIDYLEYKIAIFQSETGSLFNDFECNRQAKAEVEWTKTTSNPLIKIPDSYCEMGSKKIQKTTKRNIEKHIVIHLRNNLNDPLRSARNVNTETYKTVCDDLSKKNYTIFFMGDLSLQNIFKGKNIFFINQDSEDDNWFQIYLIATARLFIGTPSGPAWIPPLFKTKTLATNWWPFCFRRWFPGDIMLPKKLRYKGEVLRFSDMHGLKESRMESLINLQKNGYELVENTADEIIAGVEEITTNEPSKEEFNSPQTIFNNIFRSTGFYNSARIAQSQEPFV